MTEQECLEIALVEVRESGDLYIGFSIHSGFHEVFFRGKPLADIRNQLNEYFEAHPEMFEEHV
jgi:hypothetical protein